MMLTGGLEGLVCGLDSLIAETMKRMKHNWRKNSNYVMN